MLPGEGIWGKSLRTMSRDTHVTDSPLIDSRDQLIEFFAGGEKPKEKYRVGTETEKISFEINKLEPVSYDDGIGDLLRGMMRFGWTPEPSPEFPLALVREGASVTLEPGGQVELSGAPLRSIHETAGELRLHLQELGEVCSELGMVFSTLGCRPFKGVGEVPWMPRERYAIMREYLRSKGRSGHHMMLLSAAIQANYDYSSEADMAAKLRCGMSLSPVIAAMFANSPYESNKWSGWRSRRYAMWFELDPDRCGFIPCVYEPGFGYERYLDWVLDIPLFFVKRGDSFIAVKEFTFRDFLTDGFVHEGTVHRPTMADFELHLSTLFPEARLKKIVEVRAADNGPPEMALALSAFCKGLFYDTECLKQANAILDPFSLEQRGAMQRAVAQDGILAHGADWEIAALAEALLGLSKTGLVRQAQLDGAGNDESIYLKPLEAIVAERKTLADRLLERFGEGPFDPDAQRSLHESTALSFEF